MLTVKIKDSALEKRIAERARTFGKSTHDFVNELLSNAFPEEDETISYVQLNPRENGYILHFEKEASSEEHDDTTPFSHVNDPAEFARQLRNQIWRKQ